MRTTRTAPTIAVAAALGIALAACGSDAGDTSDSEVDQAQVEDGDAGAEPADEPAADGEVPTIAVTTNVLGDVVEAVVGDAAEVVTIMPVGADPHDFQASAQEVVAMNDADALIVNGADFEEGLLDVIDGAVDEGVPTFEAISAIDTIDFSDDDHDDLEDEDHDHEDEDRDHDEDHADEEEDHDHAEEEDHDHAEDEDHDHAEDEDHADEEEDHDHAEDEDHADEEEDHDDHDHSGTDPHFFTDPMRMAVVVDALVDFLQDEVTFADPAAVDASAEAYIAELTALDGEVAELVESIPEARRVLVTNHEVFGYFADRYGFEVVGAVIPGGSTTEGVSAADLAELAETIEAEGVPAIFSDTSSSNDLIDALSGEVGDIAVVELYSESLGEADSDGATYLGMVRTNAQRISEALA